MDHIPTEQLADLWLARFGTDWMSVPWPRSLVKNSTDETVNFWLDAYVRLSNNAYFEYDGNGPYVMRVRLNR